MRTPTNDWENLLLLSGSPDNVLLVGFKNDKLKPLTGKTLAEVAKMRGKSPEETAMDLVIEDGSRVGTVYFIMSEDNVKRETGLPWMSFGSDEASPAPEGVFLKSQSHPRAYGNVARLLGKYVRDEHSATLQDAVRRLTSLPATNIGIKQRGSLKPGYYADVVVFDPATIQDHATFAKPDQLATGVEDVFVNGVQVLRNGKHTGAKPGRFVRGPGWTGWPGGGACK
jgi:N-acyl-D-amino-acid deacylase